MMPGGSTGDGGRQNLNQVNLEDIEVSTVLQHKKKKLNVSYQGSTALPAGSSPSPEYGLNRKQSLGSIASNLTRERGSLSTTLARPFMSSQQSTRIRINLPENFVPGQDHPQKGPAVSKSSLLHQKYRNSSSSRGDNLHIASLNSISENTTEQKAPTPVKKKKKKKKLRIRGGLKKITPITDLHEQYYMTMGMMVGMRCAVGREDLVKSHTLVLTDFMQVDKYKFPPAGNPGGRNPTPPHNLPYKFKFKDYAPRIFQHIRNAFGVQRGEYILSVAGNQNFLEFISNSKSGQFFFYSHDGRYMIKTMSGAETKFLRRILPHYFQHITRNPGTLLTRFYGMHRVKLRAFNRQVHFVIMESVFNTSKSIHTLYDLKGSTKGRKSKPHEKEAGAPMKDLDLLEDGVKLYLGRDVKQRFMKIIEKDVQFLTNMKIMDYSLLVGIHDRWEDEQQGEFNEEQPQINTDIRDTIPSKSHDRNRIKSYDLSPLCALNRPQTLQNKSSFPALPKIDEPTCDDSDGGNRMGTPESQYNMGREEDNSSQSNMAQEDDPPMDICVPPEVLQPEGPTTGGWKQMFNFNQGKRMSFPVPDSSLSQKIPGEEKESLKLAKSSKPPVKPAISRATKYLVEDEIKEPFPEEIASAEEAEDEASDEGTDSDAENSDSEIDSEEEAMLAEEVQISTLVLSPRDESVHSNSTFRISFPKPLKRNAKTSSEVSSNDSVLHRQLRLTQRKDNGIYSQKPGEEPGRSIYFLGIIDILQQYNLRKSVEHMLRGVVSDVKTISAVSPEAYGDRFIKFLQDNTN